MGLILLTKNPNVKQTTINGYNALVYAYEKGDKWIVQTDLFDEWWNWQGYLQPQKTTKKEAEQVFLELIGTNVLLISMKK